MKTKSKRLLPNLPEASCDLITIHNGYYGYHAVVKTLPGCWSTSKVSAAEALGLAIGRHLIAHQAADVTMPDDSLVMIIRRNTSDSWLVSISRSEAAKPSAKASK